MKFQTTFIMERIESYFNTFQRQIKADSRDYHYYFALAMALSLYELKDETELNEVIKTFIQHTPYPKSEAKQHRTQRNLKKSFKADLTKEK